MKDLANTTIGTTETGIGTLKESSLHAALKDWLSEPGDMMEVPVDGYLIDIVREDLLLEIQTANFSALKAKLKHLLNERHVRVIYPVASERWIRRIKKNGHQISRRKSPKRGRFEDVFTELLRIPQQASHPNFSMELLLIQEEIDWRDDGKGSWRRRGWSISDRRLLAVIDRKTLHKSEEFLSFLPGDLSDPFTNQELAEVLEIRPRLAQQMTYCLRNMGLLSMQGKKGRYNLYSTGALASI